MAEKNKCAICGKYVELDNNRYCNLCQKEFEESLIKVRNDLNDLMK